MRTSRSAPSLHTALLLALGLLAAGPGGCGSTPRPVRTTTTPDAAPATASGRIQVDCEPGAAQVHVDDRPHGTAAEIAGAGGLSLEQGHRRIEIKLEGYHPFRFELILGSKPEMIKVRLRPVGKQP